MHIFPLEADYWGISCKFAYFSVYNIYIYRCIYLFRYSLSIYLSVGRGGREGETGAGDGEAEGERGSCPGDTQRDRRQARAREERERGEWVSMGRISEKF